MTGIERIAAERKRQKNEEGFDAEHDSQHDEGQLAWAACYYAMPRKISRKCGARVCDIYPNRFFQEANWDWDWAKREGKSSLRCLEIAGALLAAEIDRRLAAGEEA